MDEEVERAQRLAPAGAVGVSHDEVAAEAHQRRDAPFERRGVEVLAGDEAEARRAERAAVDPHRRGTDARQQLLPVDRVGRHGLEQRCHRGVEATGQRVQDVIARTAWVAPLCCSTPLHV